MTWMDGGEIILTSKGQPFGKELGKVKKDSPSKERVREEIEERAISGVEINDWQKKHPTEGSKDLTPGLHYLLIRIAESSVVSGYKEGRIKRNRKSGAIPPTPPKVVRLFRENSSGSTRSICISIWLK